MTYGSFTQTDELFPGYFYPFKTLPIRMGERSRNIIRNIYIEGVIFFNEPYDPDRSIRTVIFVCAR